MALCVRWAPYRLVEGRGVLAGYSAAVLLDADCAPHRDVAAEVMVAAGGQRVRDSLLFYPMRAREHSDEPAAARTTDHEERYGGLTVRPPDRGEADHRRPGQPGARPTCRRHGRHR